jgi:hypothetical protein
MDHHLEQHLWSQHPVTLSPAERSAINARNRTRHGMRGSLRPVGDESQAEMDELRARWANVFNNAADPLQAANVERGLHATVLQRRGERYYHAEIDKQVREAQRRFTAREHARVARRKTLLKTDPETAVRLLKESACGCRYLQSFWDSICLQFDRGEHWFSRSQADDALRLLGCDPADEKDDNVYNFRMLNYAASPEATAAGIAWWLDRTRIPDAVLRHLDGMGLVQEECRENLHRWVTKEREELAALECELRTEIEEPALAEAAQRALILKDDKAANYDRYFRMQTSAFHRAEKSLKESLRKPLQPAPGPAPPPPPGDGPRNEGLSEHPPLGRRGWGGGQADAVVRGTTPLYPPFVRGDEDAVSQATDLDDEKTVPLSGDGPDVSRGVAEIAETTFEEPVAATPEAMRPDSSLMVEPSALPDEADATIVPADTERLATASLLAMAPPPPRASYLVETARRLIAQATTDGPPPSTPSAAPAGCIRGPYEVALREMQVTMGQEDMATDLADENAPKEIRSGTAGPPGSGPLPAAGHPAGVHDPPDRWPLAPET